MRQSLRRNAKVGMLTFEDVELKHSNHLFTWTLIEVEIPASPPPPKKKFILFLMRKVVLYKIVLHQNIQ